MTQKAGFFRGILFVIAGILLIWQPYVKALSVLGWIILIPGALTLVLLILRGRKAKQMQKNVIAAFSSGDCVYATGFKVGGMLYDLSVPGAGVHGITFDAEKGELSIYYSFLSRKGGREGDVVTIPVATEESDKAKTVLEHFALPTVEEAKAKEEEKKAALENETKSGK